MDDTINFKFYFQSSSEAIADMKKKEGKMEIQKLEYLKKLFR